jgi:hypothetical protein
VRRENAAPSKPDAAYITMRIAILAGARDVWLGHPMAAWSSAGQRPDDFAVSLDNAAANRIVWTSLYKTS